MNSQVDIVALLPPPPTANSGQQRADLEKVLAAQREAQAAGTIARAVADSELTCARFKDVLGPSLKSKAAAAALRFLTEAAISSMQATSPPKLYWKRSRPYMSSAAVRRLADAAPDGEMATTEYPRDPKCAVPPSKDAGEMAQELAARAKARREDDFNSYPSGHAAFGMSCAILLAAIVPEKRAELFARGKQYGESRLIVGAHYPTDVEVGARAALIGATLLMQNAEFERRLFELRTELRVALGYPAKVPDLEPNKKLFEDEPVLR